MVFIKERLATEGGNKKVQRAIVIIVAPRARTESTGGVDDWGIDDFEEGRINFQPRHAARH